ncbi:MAG: hypothetical protein ACOCTT_03030 [archaeon]
MESIVIRVESGLKKFIQKLSEEQNRSMSEVTRDLIKIGIEAEKEGGLKITGPYGTQRPLSTLKFKGEEQRLAIRMNKELINKLKNQFGKETRKSARKAIRLGSLLIKPEQTEIKGIIEPKKLFDGEKIEIEEEEAREAIERLEK